LKNGELLFWPVSSENEEQQQQPDLQLQLQQQQQQHQQQQQQHQQHQQQELQQQQQQEQQQLQKQHHQQQQKTISTESTISMEGLELPLTTSPQGFQKAQLRFLGIEHFPNTIILKFFVNFLFLNYFYFA
jgi:membrane glycosyltransferase